MDDEDRGFQESKISAKVTITLDFEKEIIVAKAEKKIEEKPEVKNRAADI